MYASNILASLSKAPEWIWYMSNPYVFSLAIENQDRPVECFQPQCSGYEAVQYLHPFRKQVTWQRNPLVSSTCHLSIWVGNLDDLQEWIRGLWSYCIEVDLKWASLVVLLTQERESSDSRAGTFLLKSYETSAPHSQSLPSWGKKRCCVLHLASVSPFVEVKLPFFY